MTRRASKQQYDMMRLRIRVTKYVNGIWMGRMVNVEWGDLCVGEVLKRETEAEQQEAVTSAGDDYIQ
jgi:hypothetical protein